MSLYSLSFVKEVLEKNIRKELNEKGLKLFDFDEIYDEEIKREIKENVMDEWKGSGRGDVFGIYGIGDLEVDSKGKLFCLVNSSDCMLSEEVGNFIEGYLEERGVEFIC